MRSKLLAIVVIGIFMLSMTSAPRAQTENFELDLVFRADMPYLDSVASLVEQQLSPLLIKVNPSGMPRPGYFTALSTFNYDLALVSLDLVNEEFPSLWSQFHPDTYTGQDIYSTANTNLLNSAEIDNPQDFFTLLEQYEAASNITTKQQLASTIQEIYTSSWLLDIPLVSTATVKATWKAFETYDGNEGLINSLFLGADWSSNPSERSNSGSTTEEFHSAILDLELVRNPLYYQSRGDLKPIQALFSSAFLTDADDNLHPNLAISYNVSDNTDGGTTWTLNLRDDAFWSDGEQLDAYDLKFTYDLATFDWIGSTNAPDWNAVTGVDVLDSYTIQVHFDNNALVNKFILANEYIVPEHILNQTFISGGQERHPYDGFSPANSDLWSAYISDPITAGPYRYDDSGSSSNVISLVKDNNYWSPSIDDSPNQIFDLVTNTTGTPYFFDGFDEVKINNLIYHLSGSENIDPNTLITSFTTGSRDLVEFGSLPSDSVLSGDSRFQVEAIGNEGGGLAIIFNTNHPDLSIFDVRKAINQAIKRSDVALVVGQGHLVQKTPVSKYYPDYYNPSAEIVESFEEARDTFRQLGYDALEATTGESEFIWPWERLPIPFVPIFVALTAVTMVRIYSRRKN